MAELLDLSKVVETDTIRLKSKKHTDGKPYDLINRSDLGIFEYHKLQAMQTQAATLTAAITKGPLDAKKKAALMKVLGGLVKLLIPTIEPATLATLTRPEREQIILTWLARHFDPAELGGTEGEAPRRPRTGAASSPGSRRSTAATQRRGSTSRRGS